VGKLVFQLWTGVPDKAPISRDKAYLVTGGLGGLGLKVAEWLVEQGAGGLILMSRREPEEVRAQLAAFSSRGTRVLVACGDAANDDDVLQVVARASELGLPLAGVVHAAGVLDDGLVHTQNWQRFERVLAPKIAGTANLERALQQQDLDFFVMFSSRTSLYGREGQLAYAAANGYLDGTAHRRRQRGLPGVAINWCAWSEVGMAARANIIGVTSSHVSPEQGIEILGAIVGNTAVQVDVGANRVTQQATATRTATAPKRKGRLREEIGSLAARSRKPQLVQSLTARVHEVLGDASRSEVDPEAALPDLGIDSLMALHFSNQISSDWGERISATLIHQFPSISLLADHLLEQLEPPSQPAQSASAQL
jgi:NAD(P)-dependent dehydrogenase (short-subunit alcohol dehydrogenase family)